MSANNTDILVSNETNTTSSNNELNKTSTDSKTNSTNSQAEKRPHDNSGSYFNCFFHKKWVDIFSEVPNFMHLRFHKIHIHEIV